MRGYGSECWAVVGGGILGQALALKLQRSGKQVVLLEAAPELGGLASTWTVDGLTYDKFYHVILPFDQRLVGLLDDLGLSDEIVWKKTRTGFFSDGTLTSLDGALDYLRLNSVGLWSKLRIAYLMMTAGRIEDGTPLEQISVKDWLVQKCGPEAYDRLWRPLLRAKLGDNAKLASANFIWSSIRRLYLARQGANKVEQLGYVREGGYRRILDALRTALEKSGVEIRTRAPAKRIYRAAGGVCVETAQGSQIYQNVVSTLPTSTSLKVCEGLNPDETARLTSVVYQGIICASVVLNRPLGGYYLTYLTDETLPFTGIVEMSALTGTDAMEGKTLVYLPRYVTQDDEFWSLDDDEIKQRFTHGLRKVYPDLDDADIVDLQLARVREVMAVPTLGYRDRIPPVTTSIPGLYFVNSAQIVDGTLNVNATLGVLERAWPELDLGAPSNEARSAA